MGVCENLFGNPENQTPGPGICSRTGVGFPRGLSEAEAAPQVSTRPNPTVRAPPGCSRRAEGEQNPVWTGIWFKVECSLKHRVTTRPGNPGNGGHPTGGDKLYNMGDET
ncbi:hypothetical protein GCM10009642_10660 [Nocardiopsis metallicus]